MICQTVVAQVSVVKYDYLPATIMNNYNSIRVPGQSCFKRGVVVTTSLLPKRHCLPAGQLHRLWIADWPRMGDVTAVLVSDWLAGFLDPARELSCWESCVARSAPLIPTPLSVQMADQAVKCNNDANKF